MSFKASPNLLGKNSALASWNQVSYTMLGGCPSFFTAQLPYIPVQMSIQDIRSGDDHSSGTHVIQ